MDENFAEAFRLARQSANLSQAEVADRMKYYGYEMSQPVIGKVERGERRVSIGEGEALSSIVGKSTRTLIEGPAAWRIDAGVNFLTERKESLIEAIERYESAQLVLAEALDHSTRGDTDKHPSTAFNLSVAKGLLAQTVRDVVSAYENELNVTLVRDAMRLENHGVDVESSADEDAQFEAANPHLSQLMQARARKLNTLTETRGEADARRAIGFPATRFEVNNGTPSDSAE